MKAYVFRLFTMVVAVILMISGSLIMVLRPSKPMEDSTQETLDEKDPLIPYPQLPRGTRSPTDWPMHRYDLSHSGFTTSSVPDDETILWSNTTGSGDGYGSPVVEDGRIFIGSRDGYLYCFDLNTGERLWRTFLSSSDFGVCSSPAVANDHVVVFSSGDDNVYRLRVSDGGINWTFNPPGGGDYGGSSPAINNGRIYVGSGNKNVYCLDETTGSVIWTYTTGDCPVSFRDYGVQSSPAVANGRVFIGACDAYIHCINESQPGPVADYYWRTYLFDAIFGSPAVANGRVYCGSGYYNYGEGTGSHTMFCLDELTGNVIWSFVTGSDILSSPAIAYGNCYFTSTDGLLYCVDAMHSGPTSPSVIWSNTTGDTWSSPSVSDGKVVVGSRGTNTIYCYNATTGILVWSHNFGNYVYSSPAIADGKVVVGVRGSPEAVYCFGTSSPEPTVDSIQIEDQPNGTGSPISDQTVDVGETITGYAVAYNGTAPIYDVQVNWSVANGSGANASTDPTFFVTSSDFYSGFYGGTATWTADDGNGHSDFVSFTINPPEVDEIRIVNAEGPGATRILDDTVNIGYTIQGYVAGYNSTTGYLGNIVANWSVMNISGASAFTSPLQATNSTFNASLTGGLTIWTADDGMGHNDTVQFTINDPNVDYITIVDAENSGSSIITDKTVDVGYIIQGYAASFNYTADYIGDVPITWSVVNSSGAEGFTNPISGFNSTVNVGLKGGTVEWIADDGNGHSDNVVFNINPPNIDYIIIRTGPNGTGSWVGDSTYIFGDSDTFYAAGYNYTADWIEDVSAFWESDDPFYGNVSSGPSNSSTFSALNNGTCIVNATYNSHSNSTGVLSIINYSVDYIVIRNLPENGGSPIGDLIFNVGETATFYAAAYNRTAPGDGYIGDVSVDWECSNDTIATVSTPGIETLFSAQFIGGECNVTARYGPTIFNMTGNLTVLTAKLDYILITDARNGDEIAAASLDVGEVLGIYASGYNSSGPTYLGLFIVEWSQSPYTIGSFASSPSSFTNFTAGLSGGFSTIFALNTTLNVSDNFTLTINDPNIDYIQIRDAADGERNIITTATYAATQEDRFYAAAYNYTVNYLYDVDVVWSTDDPLVAQVTSPGNWTTFTAHDVEVESICYINATYSAQIRNSTLITVLPLTVDYIQIRDAPNGEGNIVSDRIYAVWELDEFYAAGCSNIVGYLFDVAVNWSSDNPSVGNVTSSGFYTNFTAQLVDELSTCSVIAQYSVEISNSTGTLTVLPPKIDYIQILDEEDNLLDTLSLNWGDWIICYARGYNKTVGPIGYVEVSWSIDDEIGTLNPLQGYYTNLTAIMGGSTTVFATYDMTVSNSTEAIMNPRISAPTGIVVTPLPQGNALNISWNPNPEENLAGYHIYRSLTLDGNYLQINTELVINEYYIDAELVNGVRYYYIVVAIDIYERSSEDSEKESGMPDFDTDGDGKVNYEDEDDDNDNIPDINDAFPLDDTEWLDSDGDEIGNNADDDDDNDGVPDSKEDKNGNGIVDPGETDPLDPDSDDDGRIDGEDNFPLNPKKWRETAEGLSLILLLLLLIPIIVVILVLILLFAIFKKRKPEPVYPPVQTRTELPPPPPWFKSERESPPPAQQGVPPPYDDEVLLPEDEDYEPPPPDDEDYEPPPPDD